MFCVVVGSNYDVTGDQLSERQGGFPVGGELAVEAVGGVGRGRRCDVIAVRRILLDRLVEDLQVGQPAHAAGLLSNKS